jgi:hypothetical protein
MTAAEIVAGLVKGLVWEDGVAQSPFGPSRIMTGAHVSYYNGFEFRAGDHLAAARAYDAAAIWLHGEFARLNFPAIAAFRGAA